MTSQKDISGILPACEDLDPALAGLASEVLSMTWDRPGLTSRERCLLMITADVANMALGGPFRTHVAAAQNAGLSKEVLREAMLPLAYYMSFPKAMQATAELVRLCGPFEPEKEGIDVAATPDASVVKLLTGGPIQEGLRTMNRRLAELSFRVSMNLWRRPLLTRRERALMCLANVCNQTLDDPFDIHVFIALRTGATPAALREVIIQMAYCASFPKALQAMLALERQLKLQSP